MVLREPHNQHRCLVHEARVELGLTEASRGRMQGRVGQIQVRDLHDRHWFETCDIRRDRDVIGEVEVFDRHLAKRSRSSWSSSTMRRRRARNFGSFRRRSTASANACFTVSLTL